ncbi:hypothetical protein KZZ20_06865 [Methylacidiphilum fumariolicum]|nr:hypothetical protein [Candidatus Methylacidiphilum fumarolicum]MBW6415235.1 hypothetical protein [Candidatus Methylacidiphilum fumarolicum]
MQRNNNVSDRLYKTQSWTLPQSWTLEGGDHAGTRQSAEGSLLLRMRVAGRTLSRGKRVGNASLAPSPTKVGCGVSPGKGGDVVKPPLSSLMDIYEPR